MIQEITQSPLPERVSALRILAERLSVDQEKLLHTLKSTVFKGATNEELLTLTVVANAYGLNPLIKEIYAFPAKGGGIVPVVSIDGWLRIINDHPQMDGITVEFLDGPDGKPISCTASIYRKDRTHPTVVTEYFSECVRNTEPWKMAHRMLRHKAITQCGRVAFGFSGLQDPDEAQDSAERTVKGREVAMPVKRAALIDPVTDLTDPFPVEDEWSDEAIDAKFPDEGGAQ